MSLCLTTLGCVVAFLVTMAVVLARKGGRDDGTPPSLWPVPVFSLLNGALFSIDVWFARVNDGLLTRGFWTVAAFFIAWFAFQQFGAMALALLVGFITRK